MAELQSPYGWPSVVALFHLKNSLAYFGRSDKNDFIIPKGPSSFGFLMKTDSGVVMNTYQSVYVQVNNEPVRQILMKSDRDAEGPTMASYKSLQWHIIERGSNYYLRVKDTLSEYRTNLTTISAYPINEDYRILAKAIDTDNPSDSISYTNILGLNIVRPIAALLEFTWNDEIYRLTALDNDSSSYFVMVHDRTSGISTYGGGRYLYPEKNSRSGVVVLDFNKLINPPCVFTPYATCPLPPKVNHLPFEIKAGEKNMHLY